MYRNEMGGETQHKELLKALIDHKGTAMISGYDNPLYNRILDGWTKAVKTTRANSAEERQEVIWMNYETQISMF